MNLLTNCSIECDGPIFLGAVERSTFPPQPCMHHLVLLANTAKGALNPTINEAIKRPEASL